ncbi:MAG: flagellar motor switch protein FliN [Pseudomonadota bacterium]
MSNENEKIDLDDLTSNEQSSDDDIVMATDGFAGSNLDPVFDAVHDVSAESLGAIYDVPVQVSAVLGKTSMPISQLIKLGRGAILELDRKVGESIDIVVNNRLVAKGEIVIVDERIGITMTEIIKKDG